MPDFGWKVIDDASQDIPPAIPAADRPKRRTWIVILIATLALGVTGIAAYQVVLHIAEGNRQATIEQDVLASHGLALRAASEADADLLDVLLPEAESSWNLAQRMLLGRRLMIGRYPFGLSQSPDDPQEIEVSLSPDLSEAEVLSDRAYAVDASIGVTETAYLRLTSVYSFDGQRWVYSPPGREFWGGPITTTGRILTLVYPERDEEIGRRLARDIDAVLLQLCADLGSQDCPAGTRVRLRLEDDPFSLARMAEPVALYARKQDRAIEFEFPAPTLFGVPLDEPSYQVLYRIYAGRAARVVSDNLTGTVVRGATDAFYQSALDRLMVKYGLRNWPAIPADDVQTPPPIPLPEQDIAVYCIETLQQRGGLCRYSPATDTWSRELSDRLIDWMAPLPADKGIVMLERSAITDTISPQIVLWRPGQEQAVLGAPPLTFNSFLVSHSEPNGEKLLIYTSIASGRLIVVDLGRCDGSTGCEWNTVSDIPVWSPDGSHTIVQSPEGMLFLGDAFGQTTAELGFGLDPFWIDDSTFGYIALSKSGPPTQIVTATLADGQPNTILKVEDILRVLPGSLEPSEWYIREAAPDQPETDRLLVTLSNIFPGYDRRHTLLVDLRTGETTLIRSGSDYVGYDFSPGGRWVTETRFDAVAQTWSTHFYDVEHRRFKSIALEYPHTSFGAAFPRNYWSADGQWFLALSDGVLHLVAPGYDYEQTVIPELPGCIFAAWVNRE
jgi:hypothetical protein